MAHLEYIKKDVGFAEEEECLESQDDSSLNVSTGIIYGLIISGYLWLGIFLLIKLLL
jgi:hypothetical protein